MKARLESLLELVGQQWREAIGIVRTNETGSARLLDRIEEWTKRPTRLDLGAVAGKYARCRSPGVLSEAPYERTLSDPGVAADDDCLAVSRGGSGERLREHRQLVVARDERRAEQPLAPHPHGGGA